MPKFILNNQLVDTKDLSLSSTVLDFVRYQKHLYGTKTGCREGDCGACTVLVGDFEQGQLRYRSMTSCLMPLGNAHGKHILTVEGINFQEGLSPAQKAMQETHGSQCGFCTIGFVMSLTGFVLDNKAKTYEEAIACIDGNICRCTGYKPIERAAALLCQQVQSKPETNTLAWLVEHKFVPEYLQNIPERLQKLQQSLKDTQNNLPETGRILGGGTDILVQIPEAIKKQPTQYFYDRAHLSGICVEGNTCILGAATTATEFLESEIIRSIFPNLPKYMRWVSSTPIRNMATMAGNIINASPIGDMTVFFLGLNASVVLESAQARREVALRDLYKGYKQLDKTADEHIAEIRFEIPAKNAFFNFEKVCKREHLDIASVNTACLLELDETQIIRKANLSAGGVFATPKYLKNASEYLIGKVVSEHTLQHALELVNAEVAPISDARGTADYKRFLLRQLIISHFFNFFGNIPAVQHLLLPAEAS